MLLKKLLTILEKPQVCWRMARGPRAIGLALLGILWVASSARAELVASVQLEGAGRTRLDTLLDLLPRRPPSHYSDAELYDFQRRLQALAIFDAADLKLRNGVLLVIVREKWTTIPNLSLATGKTLKDLAFGLGVEDYNFLGTGNVLIANLLREQRTFGFFLALNEHRQRERRWAGCFSASYRGQELRFDEGSSWVARVARISSIFVSPPLGSRYLRYQIGAALQYEHMTQRRGKGVASNGIAAMITVGLSFDRYHWHDLTPHGFSVSFDAGPGFLTPAAQPRHLVQLAAKGGVVLTQQLVLVARVSAAAITRGNANAALLIGSIEGVRGLDDARYRTWAQAFLNAEARQSIRVFERLALQFAAFIDAAVFQRMTAAGTSGDSLSAISVGAGVRIIPTFIARACVRVDLARLLAPEQAWFLQLGSTQYF